jgi:Ca-activated chloride channel family protein
MSRREHRAPRASSRHPVRIAMTALLVVLVFGVAMIELNIGPDVPYRLSITTSRAAEQCPSPKLHTTDVRVTVAPELRATIEQAVVPLRDQTLPDHECVRVDVRSEPPAATVRSAAIQPVDQAPDLWIPDSSLWESRVPNWQLNRTGSFATSPVVVATSQKALDELGWDEENRPTWRDALTGNRPLAVPRIAEDAADLSAVIALWQSLGKGDDAQRALVATVLAAGRAGVPTEAQAVQEAGSGLSDAPLLPISKQAVTAANQGQGRAALAAVEPTGGSPTLDYPVLAVLRSTGAISAEVATTRERAVRAVVTTLLNSRSAAIAKASGFDVSSARAAATPSVSALDGPRLTEVSTPAPVAGLAPQELAGLVDRITSMSAPSRFLAVFDVSGSMKVQAGNGQNRIQLVSEATHLAGDLLTDRAQTGLWAFSRDLRGQDDIIKIEDVGELGSGPDSHREKLNTSMARTEKLIGGNGTALFKTAVAAMKEMQGQYDPRAGNAVVLFTDGANDDPGGPSLNQTLDDLARLYDPKAPVRLICIGVGNGVDMRQLRAMSNQAGGQAFLLKRPEQVAEVLFDIINRRS